jgi:hypothetical protein
MIFVNHGVMTDEAERLKEYGYASENAIIKMKIFD